MPEHLQQRLQWAFDAHRAGRLEEARRLYREILSLDPNYPDANNLMGLVCIQSKEPVKAIRHIKRALKSDPKNAQAHYNLGVAYKNLERMPEAANAFTQAASLDDSNADYQSSAGNALRLAGRYEKAAQMLEKALRKHSGSRSLRLNLALAQNDLGARLIREGSPAQAVKHFLRAIELEPNHAQAHMNLGLTLEQMGELEQASRHYKHAIKSKPDFTDAHFQLAHLRTNPSSDDEIGAMQRLFDHSGTNERNKIRLAYGLGFALESNGKYPEAFSYMQQAHKLQSRGSPFNLRAAAERFDLIKNVFNQDRLIEPEACGPAKERPILIVGMPRSGTTLAEQILASHPEVHGNGESMALTQVAKTLGANKPYPKGLERLTEQDLLSVADGYLAALTKNAGDKPYSTDTTPMNFLFVGLAAALLPGARFVFCERDPMDNCLSIYRQMLTGANEFAHTLEDLGGYYRLHVELLDHWAAALGQRVFRLQYENIVRDTESQVKKLLEFCELSFDSNCLKFYETQRSVKSPSAAQVRQPIYNSSIGFWKHYEQELSPLKQILTA